MLSTTKPRYATGTVTSPDGTSIGYRRLGEGPGVVILHGGALASQHYMKLGAALADQFTVYLPDRRGRGMSGPYGPNYGIEREDEDLGALVRATGAQFVFGVADGGLFALHASMAIPEIRKVALFEPVVFAGQPGLDEFRAVIDRGQRLVASGDIGAAMASLANDAVDADPRDRDVSVPYRLLQKVMMQPTLCRAMLWADAKLTRGDNAALRDLIVAWKDELDVVKATEGTIGEYGNVTADVLLLCGTRAPALFTGTLDALQGVLPRSSRVEIPGLNHGGPQDQGGNPGAVAKELRAFFATG